ncbi:hypothetical protein I6F33_34645 [Bradyrhizobium sp. BRP20]|uniref:hypothetical protein n=1 Tax=Bradyrhizobium sp. BRP20 TaxID=2793822 RepID=UPI001CD54E3C|nr:hypothetical protein [Bradyrhizobium sp. BRP20]MCA1438053.1 hypothetical protein [Bradyrhizobium sp. BRP20]
MTRMKDHYNFSAARRGKFFRPDAKLVPPVHLQPDVLASLLELADARKTSLSDVVNTLLKEHFKKRP